MSVTFPAGFRANGVRAGLKQSGLADLALLATDRNPVPVAGLFTTNRFPAAPVTLSRSSIAGGTARAVIVNSGQANAGTGAEGEQDAVAVTEIVARALGVTRDKILACSTGVIGQRLDLGKIEEAVPSLTKGLSVEAGGTAFARAIMTTDKVLKEARATAGSFRVGACAKGVGMIEPNLATMLVFITTDAQVSPGALQDLASQSVRPVFEQLTVDASTSTNDTVLLFASGAAGGDSVSAGTKDWSLLSRALAEVSESLVLQLAADGEGATHVLVVEVSGADSDDEARIVAKAVANSPLVKSAAFGGDPNPGRFLQAVGSSGAAFDPADVRISIGNTVVVDSGRVVSSYADVERAAAQIEMKESQVRVTILLGSGNGSGRAIGCDLTYEYVRINAEYTN